MPSARAAAILVVSGTALLAACLAALAGWFALNPRAGVDAVAAVAPKPSGAQVHALPPGYVRMTIGGIAPTRSGNAVVLTDAREERGLLIFVGGTEALSIALRLQGRRYSRPLTHDLLEEMLGEFDGEVMRAQVDRLEDGVFFGALFLSHGERVVRVDSRPSDALAMALGNGAPVYVANQVLEVAGVDLDQVDLQDPADMQPEEVAVPAPGQVEL